MTPSGVVFRVALIVLASALCVYAFVSFFDARQVMHLVSASDGKSVLAGALVTIVTINLRAMRIGYCVDGHLTSPLVFMAYLYNALSGLLPARLGDVALPFLLRQQTRTPLGSGFGLLILLRVLDLLTLVALGSLAVVVSERSVHGSICLLAWLMLAGSCAALLACVVGAPALSRFVERHDGSRNKLWRIAAQVATPMAQIGRGRLVNLAFMSLAIWLSLFASFAMLARSIMTDVTLSQVGTAGAAASLAFAIPFSAIANVGSFEAAWVWVMHTFGHPASVALAAALLVHGVIFLVSMGFGVFGYAMMMRVKRQ